MGEDVLEELRALREENAALRRRLEEVERASVRHQNDVMAGRSRVRYPSGLTAEEIAFAGQ